MLHLPIYSDADRAAPATNYRWRQRDGGFDEVVSGLTRKQART